MSGVYDAANFDLEGNGEDVDDEDSLELAPEAAEFFARAAARELERTARRKILAVQEACARERVKPQASLVGSLFWQARQLRLRWIRPATLSGVRS